MNPEHLCVVIPALNEERSVRQVIEQTLALDNKITVIVVDDASSDETAAISEECGALVLRLALRLGPWRAMQAGLRYAYRLGYRNAITMDADGQHLPNTITEIVSEMRAHEANIVIGSAPHRGSRLRVAAWRMMQLSSGLRFSDLTSGFRFYDAKAMSLIVGSRASYFQNQDVGILALAMAHRLQIIEVDVDMAPRQQGVSRIFNSWVSVVIYMLNTLLLGLSKRSRYRTALNARQGDPR
jgi:glycosyltransferase involved in cell wall biosynthesis